MKTGIIGILYNTAKLDITHPAGWNHILKEIMFPDAEFLTENDNWHDFDQLVICHGLNYKEKSYNIVGGISRAHYRRLKMLYNFKGKILSFDNFDIKDFIKYKKIDFNWNKEWNYEKIKLPKKDKIVLGDSHSLSVWPNSEYEINRNDGKTLHGYLKNPYNLDRYTDIILYFGNIDVRHHLCRMKEPAVETMKLFNKYIDYALDLNATLVNLLPVESETRRLPKTGQYKGTNFYGTREQRQVLVHLANDLMNSTKALKTITWPQEWYDNISYYEKEIMERTQSVHIKPRYYKKNITCEQVSLF